MSDLALLVGCRRGSGDYHCGVCNGSGGGDEIARPSSVSGRFDYRLGVNRKTDGMV